MIYVLVKWKHQFPDEPNLLYSELDEHRMQRRKIDIFPDGRWGFADEDEEVGGSGLGDAATPSLEELNSDPDYEASEISRDEFERLWALRRSARPMSPFPLPGESEPN